MELVVDRDIYLVKRACSGETRAFTEIVENHRKKIFYLAYDLTGSIQDAEDLSQEVFMKAFRFLKSYKGEATLRSWFYRITLNTFLDNKRKLSFRAEREQQPLLEDVEFTAAVNPEGYAESRQIQQHLEKALGQLSPRERAVFVMRHYQELSGKEVGKLLKISEGTVKSLLFRAVKKLQKLLAVYKITSGKEVEP